MASPPDADQFFRRWLPAVTNLPISSAAIQTLKRAVVLQPTDLAAQIHLALAVQKAGWEKEAMAYHLRAVRLEPLLPDLYSNLGGCQQLLGNFDGAGQKYRQALVLGPAAARPLNNLGTDLQAIGRSREAAICFSRALAAQPNYNTAFLGLLIASTYRDDLTPQALRSLHEAFGKYVPRPHHQAPKSMTASGPLRIGYLSADLRNHPVGESILPVLHHHDRAVFSPYCYAEIRRPDAVTAKCKAAADGWRDISGMSDAEVAATIRADGIHLLVFLAGRFDGNRPQIAAHRAAPVQISLHDVATSGLAEMDYIIGDRWLIPNKGEEYFSERGLRLPQFYLGVLPSVLPEVETNDLTGPPVFACFNNPAKITDTAIALWGKILGSVPEGRLILHYMERYGSPSIRSRIGEGLTASGASSEQVCFVADPVDRHSFLARYNEIDLALDTLPFSGSTTSFQALAMGVPVITWPQGRMVSRWTASMLRGIGLPELIAGSAEEYVSLAVEMAAHRKQWRGRRREIRDRLAASRLCDAAGWTRHLERLYITVWRRYLNYARN